MKTIKGLPNTELLPNVVSQLTSERSSSIGDSFNVEKTLLSNSKGKLVLHFDINETILIGDKAGGDTVNDCLNKVRIIYRPFLFSRGTMRIYLQ